MHAKVFDTIIQTAFEATVLKAMAGIAVLMTLRLLNALMDRIISPRQKIRPSYVQVSREDGRADEWGDVT